MGRACKICIHPDRLEIDREIVQGKPVSSIALKYGLARDTVSYHAQNHLSRQLVKSHEMREALQSQGLVVEIEDLLARSKAILRKAEQDGKLNLALNAIRETRGTLELMARIAATLHQLRAQELQQAELEADDRHEEYEAEALARLSMDELTVLIAIQEKMIGERDDDVIATLLRENQVLCGSKSQAPMDASPRPRSRRTRLPKGVAIDNEEWNDERETEALQEEALLAQAEPEPDLEPEPEPEPIEPPQPPPRKTAGTWGERSAFDDRVKPGSVRTSSPELARLLDLGPLFDDSGHCSGYRG